MSQELDKTSLVNLAEQVKTGQRLDASRVDAFLAHEFPETSSFGRFMLRVAAWISLFFASVLVIFPEVGQWLISVLPGFFLLPDRIARALDYVWGLVGSPVKKDHLMYHLPNIIIFAFGAAGVRQLWRKLNKNNWKDRVEAAQVLLRQNITDGVGRFRFKPGFSLLFIGDGDQVAKSLLIDDPLIGPSVSTKKPPYTNFWGSFFVRDGDEGFRKVLEQFNSEEAGEYVLFPVVDDQLFLPSPGEHDIPPHRVEIAVRRIREFEKDQDWAPKRIVIVGDKEQKSRFVTSSADGRMEDRADDVSLGSIAEAYANVIIADPTDIALRRILEIADGRRILFRASEVGAAKYSDAFYYRLSLLNYTPTRDETLTVGYDITDLETEHQIVSRHRSEYLPVILSRDVFDFLSRTHLRDRTHIFVPRLVKEEVQRLVG